VGTRREANIKGHARRVATLLAPLGARGAREGDVSSAPPGTGVRTLARGPFLEP